MKKIFNILFLAITASLISSCDEGFDALNQSKTGATSVDPAFILNNAIVNLSPPAGTLNYEMGIVQQLISSNTGVLVGANFNQVNPNATPANWTGYFQNVVKYTNDVITRTKDDATRSNLYNMARIVQSYAFMILTDTYGSIPYSQAGQGYTAQIFFPAYDDQQTIYNGIIAELTAATGALGTGSGKVETSDVLYNGDVAKWKKFGYSVLLRAGMHISEADASKAGSAVAAALAGGVILLNADNAVNRHDANYVNGMGNTLNGTEAANFYLAQPFVDALKANNDPRLPAIAIRFVGASSGPGQTAGVAKKDAADQFGMPMGSTDATADAAGAGLPGGGSRYAFSQADRTRIIKRTSPLFLVTAAQCNLLLAEAYLRGIGTAANPATAATYFSTGISRAMDMMATYDANCAVAVADRDAFVLANPLSAVPATAREQIGVQYWITSFLMGNEAWANWRRTGFPALTPNPFPGKTVTFITRLTYPPSETLVNNENVQAAITAQGGDNLDTKVWWDK